MNLSEHFTKEEMIHSDTATAKKISNEPDATHLKTLTHTCQYLLEPLRALVKQKYGSAYIGINSGYRGPALNKAVGGVKTSQHCTGEAADCRFYYKKDNEKVLIPYLEMYNNIKEWVKAGKLSVDQCIYEVSGKSVWIHCSYKAGGASVNRKQFLKYNNGKYILDK